MPQQVGMASQAGSVPGLDCMPDLMPRLLGVHGAKRSGKGSIAAHLVARHGYECVKFSAALKDMVSIVLAMTCGLDDATIERCIESDLKEVPIARLGGKSTRYAMQVIGTEWRDAVSTPMWTRMALRRIQAIHARSGRVVVDDLRFGHEMALLAPLGAHFWLVTRPVVEQPTGPVVTFDGPVGLDLSPAVLEAMTACLLSHCGLDALEVERSLHGDLAHAGLDVLGGRSAAYCLHALREVWLPLMVQPCAPTPASTSVHSSEAGLAPGLFSHHLHNSGSLGHLHRLVDQALGSDQASMALVD